MPIWYYIYVLHRDGSWLFITVDEPRDYNWLWWDVTDLRDADLFCVHELDVIIPKLLDDERIKTVQVIERGEPVLN